MPKVTAVEQVPGFREWRFVPVGWESPLQHHIWCEIEDPETVARLRLNLKEVTDLIRWWLGDGTIYKARIDWHPVERPVLVLVGNIR